MGMVMARYLPSLIAAGALSGAVWADDWTSRKAVAKSAQELADTTEKLQKAIKDVDQDSPLIAEVGTLSKSAHKLLDSVENEATHEDAKKDFGKIETGYVHFEAGLKKAHDIHHEKPVADAAKKVKSTFDQLKAHMSGQRPTEKPDQAGTRATRKDFR